MYTISILFMMGIQIILFIKIDQWINLMPKILKYIFIIFEMCIGAVFIMYSHAIMLDTTGVDKVLSYILFLINMFVLMRSIEHDKE